MTTKLKERVKKGIEFLNNEIPKWKEEIEVDMLDLGSCRRCILGQIFDDYEEGLDKLDILESSASDYGFTLSQEVIDSDNEAKIKDDFECLTNAWRDALK